MVLFILAFLCLRNGQEGFYIVDIEINGGCNALAKIAREVWKWPKLKRK
jgi:hypothetical protein